VTYTSSLAVDDVIINQNIFELLPVCMAPLQYVFCDVQLQQDRRFTWKVPPCTFQIAFSPSSTCDWKERLNLRWRKCGSPKSVMKNSKLPMAMAKC